MEPRGEGGEERGGAGGSGGALVLRGVRARARGRLGGRGQRTQAWAGSEGLGYGCIEEGRWGGGADSGAGR